MMADQKDVMTLLDNQDEQLAQKDCICPPCPQCGLESDKHGRPDRQVSDYYLLNRPPCHAHGWTVQFCPLSPEQISEYDLWPADANELAAYRQWRDERKLSSLGISR
jgi:hypothetical protein